MFFFILDKMAQVIFRLKLHVTYEETNKETILDLPTNDDIFEIFKNKEEPILIVDEFGEVKQARAFITLVDENNCELV